MAIDDLPDGYVVQSQPDPSELPDGYMVKNNDTSSGDSTKNLGLPYAELARGVIGAGPSVVDFSARLPTWAYNTLRPDSLAPADYPPSLNDAAQNMATAFGLPRANQGDPSRILEGAAFGVPGIATATVGNVLNNNYPAGNSNITVGDRDIGVSPNDLITGGMGMASQGALSPKPAMMENIKNSEEGRLGQINADQGIPNYLTDVTKPGGLLSFLNSTPFSGKEGRGVEQQSALNSAVTKTFGENSDVLTPKIMQQADTRIGNDFNDIAKNNDVQPQHGSNMITAIGDLQTNKFRFQTADNQRILSEYANDILDKTNKNGSMNGQDWMSEQQRLGKEARKTNDDQLSSGLYDLQSTMRDAMRNSLTADQAAKFDKANQQYRAMIASENAVKQGLGTGNVSPQALLTGANKTYPNLIYNDPNTIPQLAQSSQLLKNAQRNSDKYQMAQHRMPFEGGQIAAYAATPFGALLNRSFNTKIDPIDWNSPYSAAFGRAMKGGAVPFSLSPQVQQWP